MQSSSNLKALIQNYEGCRLKAYLCPSGIWSIGWGRTRGVEMGMEITEEQAVIDLLEDIESADQFIARHVRYPLTQFQHDAFADFVYNVKRSEVLTSTLLRLINLGGMEEAAREFPRWIYGGPAGRKSVLPGLVKRRKSERLLFETGKLVLY